MSIYPLLNRLKKRVASYLRHNQDCNLEEWNLFCKKFKIDNRILREWSYTESVNYFITHPNKIDCLYDALNNRPIALYVGQYQSPITNVNILNDFKKLSFKERKQITIQYMLLYNDIPDVFEDIDPLNLSEIEGKRLKELIEKTRYDKKYIAAVNVSKKFIPGVLHEDDIQLYLKCEYRIQLYILESQFTETEISCLANSKTSLHECVSSGVSSDNFTKNLKRMLYFDGRSVEECINRLLEK